MDFQLIRRVRESTLSGESEEGFMRDDLTEGLKELECKAIERLKYAENLCGKLFPDDMLTLCYSGGKDSDVTLHLALKSGIRFRVVER